METTEGIPVQPDAGPDDLQPTEHSFWTWLVDVLDALKVPTVLVVAIMLRDCRPGTPSAGSAAVAPPHPAPVEPARSVPGQN